MLLRTLGKAFAGILCADYFSACLLFVTTPGLEPTSNLAAQALRFVVLDRRITQGTRTVKGRTARETLWTLAATCRQQGRSLCRYLVDAV